MKKKWLHLSVDDIRLMCQQTGCKYGIYKIPDNAKIVTFGLEELTEKKDIVLKIEVYDEVEY